MQIATIDDLESIYIYSSQKKTPDIPGLFLKKLKVKT